MDDWLERLVLTIGVDPLTDDQAEELLVAARDVAHGVERKITPLATFLLGAAVQREIGHGRTHTEAFDQVMASLRTIL
ncbi:MAG: DUF6457 domain-containing protein [Actinomycetota bacterium]